MALILRRNEAERKNTAQKIWSTILYSNSACTLPKGLPTSQSQPKHLILYSPFLSFCIFFLFFPRLRIRASTGLGQRQVTLCTLFLVRTCLKLPSPGHAKHCRRHHFWTGLARLFRTTRKNIDILVFEYFFWFLFFSKCRWWLYVSPGVM